MSQILSSLIQNNGTVAYASKALDETQHTVDMLKSKKSFYPLSLALSAFTNMSMDYGKTIAIETDHKPLDNIFCKPADANSRI